MRWLWLSLFLFGCAYRSQYVAPSDGRPRPVWRDDHVTVDTAGAPLTAACVQEVGWATRTRRLHLLAGDLKIDAPPPHALGAAPFVVAAVLWTPRYWGPPLVSSAPGVPAALLVPPLFLPSPGLRMAVPGVPYLGADVPNVPVLDKGDGRLWVVLAVIAVVVLPAVAIGLAASRPEDSARNAEAIDQVNVINDWLRSAGSPCALAYGVGS